MTAKTRSALVLTLAIAASGLGCGRLGADAANPAPVGIGWKTHEAATASAQTLASAAAGARKSRLKPGLWRVEGVQFDTLSERGKVYLCIDAASAALIDPPPPPAGQARCSVEDGTLKPDLYLGTTQCRYPDRTVTSRVRIDSNNLYFRDVVVQRGTAAVESSDKSSHFAEWVGRCRPEQAPGKVYTQAYGQDEMHAAELPAALISAASGS